VGSLLLARAGVPVAVQLFNVGRSLAVDIVIGFSQMVVLATGGMNLAVGSIGVCAVMFTGYLLQVVGSRSRRDLGALALGAAARLAQRRRHRQDRGEQLHHHAGEREPLLGAMLILTKAVPYNAPCRPRSASSAASRSGPVLSPLLVIAIG
jgi:ribose transport system permease protein